MNYEQMLDALIEKKERVARKSWPSTKWLINIDAEEYSIEAYKYFEATTLRPWVALKDNNGTIGPYIPTMDDMNANDWHVLGDSNIK